MRSGIYAIWLLVMSGCTITGPRDAADVQGAHLIIERGIEHLRHKEYELAEADFVVANEIVRLPAALDGLGCIAYYRGQFAAAEEYYWQAYELDTTYNNSLANLAVLYETQGKRGKATELFKRALAEDPANYRARNNYAAFLSAENKPAEEVLKELLKAQALFNHPVIYDNIVIVNGEL